MPGFSILGYSPEGFEPVEADAVAARSWVATILEADDYFDDWNIYSEPPEQLAGGPAVVVAPRGPYLTFGTYLHVDTSLVLHVLVPRSHGPAMDRIDAALAVIRNALTAYPALDLGDTQNVALLEDVGGSSYIVASMDIGYSS